MEVSIKYWILLETGLDVQEALEACQYWSRELIKDWTVIPQGTHWAIGVPVCWIARVNQALPDYLKWEGTGYRQFYKESGEQVPGLSVCLRGNQENPCLVFKTTYGPAWVTWKDRKWNIEAGIDKSERLDLLIRETLKRCGISD